MPLGLIFVWTVGRFKSLSVRSTITLNSGISGIILLYFEKYYQWLLEYRQNKSDDSILWLSYLHLMLSDP